MKNFTDQIILNELKIPLVGNTYLGEPLLGQAKDIDCALRVQPTPTPPIGPVAQSHKSGKIGIFPLAIAQCAGIWACYKFK